MKKIYSFLLICFLLSSLLNAQVSYTYSLADILAAMPTGKKMPDGTYIKVIKIKTGTGVIETSTGTSGPSMGGTLDSLWSGCSGCTSSPTTSNTLSVYTGDKNPTKFTRLNQSLARKVDKGSSTNCKDAIGWRIYFDRPLDINSFLAVDLDGNPSFNGEWSAAFSYNGNTFSNPSNKTFQTTNLQAQDITVNASHTWRTMLQTQLGAMAASNFPSTTNGFNLTRIKNSAGALDPDDINTQVLYDLTLSTDIFFLWGIWGSINNSSSQASGISPIVVNIYPDFGDAPDSYGTTLSNNGASHGQRTSTTSNQLRLGTSEDIESDGLPSSNANTSLDDDGVATVPVIMNNGALNQTISTYSLTSTFMNTTGKDANYVAWIDWNNNGLFDSSEGQTATTLAANTSGNVTFTWNNVTLSGTVGLANTYARIRVTTEVGMTTFTPGGAFKDGEVEDYLIPFSTILPLELVDFSGHLKDNDVFLNWQTEIESNLDNYEILMSKNAIDFHTIGSVPAKNNLSNRYDFNYALSNNWGTTYFRLKINELDGASTYSSIIALKTKVQDQFTGQISPNPVTSNVKFVYENPRGEFKLNLEILDLQGNLVMKKTEVVRNGPNNIQFNSNELSQGIYFLHYYDKQYITDQLIKFIVSP